MNKKVEPSKVIQTSVPKVLGSNFGQNTDCSGAVVAFVCKYQDGTIFKSQRFLLHCTCLFVIHYYLITGRYYRL